MQDAILVINAGSSSIKFAGYVAAATAEPALLGKGQVEGIGSDPYFRVRNPAGETIGEHDWPRGHPLSHLDGVRHILQWLKENAPGVRVAAAGHRVVFGGAACTGPLRIDARALAEIEALVPFFPLHLPHNLAAIRAVAELDPDLPQIACFDNTFHRTQPRLAQMFALPRRLHEQGIRRYGFHGLSYEYIAHMLPRSVPGAARVVVAHLGSGASMCALKDGASIESTLGFSGLDGLPMGTRPGALDPGVMLYLLQELGMDAAAIERLLYKESGLLGVSGISNDMRDLLASDDPRAHEAVELFCYHIAKQMGALAAVLEGLDAVVFTAGIGENAWQIRERVCRRAEWLGIRVDDAANRAGGPRITLADSAVSAWVIPTDEEMMIASHTRALLAGGG
jgi:acetate kinase